MLTSNLERTLINTEYCPDFVWTELGGMFDRYVERNPKIWADVLGSESSDIQFKFVHSMIVEWSKQCDQFFLDPPLHQNLGLQVTSLVAGIHSQCSLNFERG